ncbi:hypothetical protein PNIG_a2887 [Pseudoalteromonas nigrifaciens]|uniref:Uncharacterized protein n=1 Tax=Pseudoalteromonas nigrifaciens TaxID=28109 RepID=A0AAC9UJC4_9GAMM|nr:hypothetical protein PNIG_a2887 [Pseudoalteromonas nigrifaciens]
MLLRVVDICFEPAAQLFTLNCFTGIVTKNRSVTAVDV